jgi:PilZ domain-containing protein
MAEFIVNPRRTARAPARCRAAVVSSAGSFDAETEDIGSRGCQVVTPRHLKPGDAIELVIACEKVADPLKARGKVSWVSEQPPWRVGVAFDEPFVPSAERWFEKLVASQPRLGSYRRVPERIPVEAMVYLGPPPRFLVDFSAEEASLLRFIASGARIDELQARLRDRWPAAQRALFSLLARQAVTLSRGQSAHPDAWKRILTEVEASIAIESLGSGPPLTPPPEREHPHDPEPTPMPMEPLSAPLPPPPPSFANPAASPWGAPARHPRPALELGDRGPAPDVAPRGAGRAQPGAAWADPRSAEPPRSREDRAAEAHALYGRAIQEMEGGSVHGAIALLRKALTLAPGDPDIAAALGRLAFKDRLPGSR